MKKPILAWHFGRTHLGYDDGRQIRVGVRQRFRPLHKNNILVMCQCGLHASVNILHALSYARGTIIRRVELSGYMITGTGKICAEYRKPLWAVEGKKLLRRFACLSARDVLCFWDATDVVKQYLRTQDESIRNAAGMAAARAAGVPAYWAAAYWAAYAAAEATAVGPAGAAILAHGAAYAAAEAEDRAEARAVAAYWAVQSPVRVAREAARKKQTRRLLRMIRQARRTAEAAKG